MKRLTSLLIGAVLATPALAILAPQFHNARDLDVMVGFVKQHPKVIASLKSIDLQTHVVLFGESCVARFARSRGSEKPGIPGPAAPLEFTTANCPID